MPSTRAADKDAVVIDLSADYRFNSDWTYGLPELVQRNKIASRDPHLQPRLLRHRSPTRHRTSNPSPRTRPGLTNRLRRLRLLRRRHQALPKKRRQQPNRQPNRLLPHRPHPRARDQHPARHARGLRPARRRLVRRNPPHHLPPAFANHGFARRPPQLYQDRYDKEKLVKVSGESPQVKDIAGKHGVEVGGFAVHSSGKRAVVNVTIDNLLKGAADAVSAEYESGVGVWGI